MKRAALYVRVSTDEQKKHGLSVDNQIDALKKYCADNGYYEVGVYNDAGISARKKYTKRPALLTLIDDIRADKVDIVLFTRLDRFFRSVGDYYTCIEQMKNIPWRAIWEDYETETANGILKVNIMLSVAQSEADRTSEKIKSVLDYKRERGDYVGSAPIGYKKIKNQLYIDKDVEPILRAFFTEFLNTMSTSKALRKAISMGLVFDTCQARRIIRNPIYRGTASNGYKVEPYLNEDDSLRLEEYLKTINRSPRATKRTYIFSGMCTCKYCGKRLIGNSHSNGIQFYYCPSKFHIALTIGQKKLENYLINNIDDAISHYISTIEAKDKTQADQTKKINNINAKLERLTFLYEEGDIDLESYKAKRDSLKLELSKIKPVTSRSIERLPDKWQDIYYSLDAEHRRTFWLKIISRIEIDNDKDNIDIVFY